MEQRSYASVRLVARVRVRRRSRKPPHPHNTRGQADPPPSLNAEREQQPAGAPTWASHAPLLENNGGPPPAPGRSWRSTWTWTDARGLGWMDGCVRCACVREGGANLAA
eukprot:scaffold569_cov408-Prasinococcus_capsulatus_cf.AAC.20